MWLNQGLVFPIRGSGPSLLSVGQISSSLVISFSCSDSTDSESSSVLLPYFDDLVSLDLFLSIDFFLFSPSFSSSSSLPSFDPESKDPLKLVLLEIGVFEAGCEDWLGLSLVFELLLDELPELEALSLLESPAFWMIFPWVEAISVSKGCTMNSL